MATAPHTQRLMLTVGDESAGERLDVWLQHQLPDHSRAFLQRLIQDHRVEIQNPESKIQNPKPSHRIHPGETVLLTIPPPEPSKVAPEAIPLDVLYEDDDLIVINKPPGLVVHPCPGHRAHTLVYALLHHCRGRLSGIGGVERPGIVHRLDHYTSGCLVAAKNDVAHRALQAQFKSREVAKHYLALVWGVPRLARGRIEAAIGRSARDRKKMMVVRRGGREAVTEFEVLKAFGEASLVRCELHTGRTHQIRVHLAALGHPVIGDKVYGPGRRHLLTKLARRQMLHAHVLAFDHPRTHKRLEFTAPLPQDMREMIERLESGKRDE
jgi:23S rRNA pseudouridine1911/1915/1917 synthase